MNKRKIGLIAGGLCLLVVAGVFIMKMQFESKVRGDIENFLAALPAPLTAKADKIDVSFFDKSVNLAGLKGTYTVTLRQSGKEESFPMDFSCDRVAATGVNIDGFKEGAGTAKLLNSLVFANFALNSPLATASIENYTIEGVSGDFQQMLTELAKSWPALMAANAVGDYPVNNEETQKLMGAFAGIFTAYETVTVARSSFKNYKYSLDVEGDKVDVSMGSAEGRDYSIRKMGPLSMANLKSSLNGVPLLEMASFSVDGMVLPSFTKMFEILAKDANPSPFMLQMALKGQDFALNNLRIKGLTVFHPEHKGRVLFALADSDFSYVAEAAHAVDFTFNGLNLDKQLLLQESGLPAEAFAKLPDTITLEGAVQQEATQKDQGAVDVNAKKIFFKGTGLGEASLVFAADNINLMAMMMGSPGGAALKNFDLSLTDGGLSDVFFAVNGLYEGESAQDMRAEILESLKEQLELETTAAGKEILPGVISFLEKTGGTFRIVIAPPSPATADKLMMAFASDPSALGLSVTFTPGN